MKPTPFETAGTVLRDNVDAPTTPAHHAMLRARLIDAVERPSRRRGPSRWLLLAPAAAVLVAVLWFGVWRRHNSAVTFRVGPENAAGVVGEYVNPVDHGELTLTFSEGSKVTLGPQARARVAKTTSRGASVVLESGGARVDVVHRPGADWSVAAGPYTVAVKGTSFDVKWDAPSSTLQVVMHNGVVVVRGPGVESGVEVRDTQRFVSRAVAAIDSADAAAPPPLGQRERDAQHRGTRGNGLGRGGFRWRPPGIGANRSGIEPGPCKRVVVEARGTRGVPGCSRRR